MTDRHIIVHRDNWAIIERANRENARKGLAPAIRWVIEMDAPRAMYLYSLRIRRND